VTEGKTMVASFDYVDQKEGVSYITIYESSGSPKPHESLNREVLLNGLGLVPKKLKAWERSPMFADTLKEYKKAETAAKNDRLGIWEYGDLTED
jgi:staphylococcal nuclease domain-containing protein 1